MQDKGGFYACMVTYGSLQQHHAEILLTIGACAARVTVLGLCVCLSLTAILPPHTIRRLTRGTSGYSATCTRLVKWHFLKCFVKKLGRYLKKSAIFTPVRMCEAILLLLLLLYSTGLEKVTKMIRGQLY